MRSALTSIRGRSEPRGEPAVAERYRALSQCAHGTLGHQLYQHYRDNGFAFPGENHGIPEFAVFHDIGHLLSGYGTDPAGEIQQAAFQAGFLRHDGFTFLLFGILQFHLGLRLTPIAKAEHGFFDVTRVLRAAERGAQCRVDITDFDLFAHAHEPLDELRARLGVPPLFETQTPEVLH
jgi:ubiquinone biosynthesis protein Coq4